MHVGCSMHVDCIMHVGCTSTCVQGGKQASAGLCKVQAQAMGQAQAMPCPALPYVMPWAQLVMDAV